MKVCGVWCELLTSSGELIPLFLTHSFISPIAYRGTMEDEEDDKKKQKPCAVISSYSSSGSVGTGKGEGRLSGGDGDWRDMDMSTTQSHRSRMTGGISIPSSRISHPPHVIYSSLPTSIRVSIQIF